jgi:hypothetical protein
MNVCIRKLKDTAGDSIGEVLVASLIISLGLIALVSMLMASRRLIAASDQNYSENTELRSNIELQNGTERSATVIVSGDRTDTGASARASTKETGTVNDTREILTLDKDIKIPVNALSFGQEGKEDARIFMYHKANAGSSTKASDDFGLKTPDAKFAGDKGTEG